MKKNQFVYLLNHFGLIRDHIKKKTYKNLFFPKIITLALPIIKHIDSKNVFLLETKVETNKISMLYVERP